MPEILDLQYLAYKTEASLFHDSDISQLKKTMIDVKKEFEEGVIFKVIDETDFIFSSVRAYEHEDTLCIGKLIVHPDLQGQGIGKI